MNYYRAKLSKTENCWLRHNDVRNFLLFIYKPRLSFFSCLPYIHELISTNRLLNERVNRQTYLFHNYLLIIHLMNGYNTPTEKKRTYFTETAGNSTN